MVVQLPGLGCLLLLYFKLTWVLLLYTPNGSCIVTNGSCTVTNGNCTVPNECTTYKKRAAASASTTDLHVPTSCSAQPCCLNTLAKRGKFGSPSRNLSVLNVQHSPAYQLPSRSLGTLSHGHQWPRSAGMRQQGPLRGTAWCSCRSLCKQPPVELIAGRRTAGGRKGRTLARLN